MDDDFSWPWPSQIGGCHLVILMEMIAILGAAPRAPGLQAPSGQPARCCGCYRGNRSGNRVKQSWIRRSCRCVPFASVLVMFAASTT